MWSKKYVYILDVNKKDIFGDAKTKMIFSGKC